MDRPFGATPREAEVVEACADYGFRKIAADELGVTLSTIDEHLGNLRRKAEAAGYDVSGERLSVLWHQLTGRDLAPRRLPRRATHGQDGAACHDARSR